MSKVFLSLGGNLGDRFESLRLAVEMINTEVGLINQQSSIYETKAWGKADQPDYLNMVVELETVLQPEEILKKTQQIEIKLGRTRHQKWDARTIDIDILFMDQQIISSDTLLIPHPLINMRKFVLQPMIEIAPDFIHPVSKASIKNLYLNCSDSLQVDKLNIKSSI